MNQPNDEGRPIGPQPDRPPLDPMTAGLAAWNAMVDLVGAAVAASERVGITAQLSPPEAERWLATIEAIVECLETVLSHTRIPGVSTDELIVARRALRRAREAYAAYKANLAAIADDRATAPREEGDR